MQQLPRSTQRIPVGKDKHIAHVDTVREYHVRTDTVIRVDTLVIFHQDTLVFERFFVKDTVRDTSTVGVPIPIPLPCVLSSTHTPVTQATITPEPSAFSLVILGAVVLFIMRRVWTGQRKS